MGLSNVNEQSRLGIKERMGGLNVATATSLVLNPLPRNTWMLPGLGQVAGRQLRLKPLRWRCRTASGYLYSTWREKLLNHHTPSSSTFSPSPWDDCHISKGLRRAKKKGGRVCPRREVGLLQGRPEVVGLVHFLLSCGAGRRTVSSCYSVLK